MDDSPTLFDTSIYNVAPPRISDYDLDVDYDPHWAQFERRRYRQLDGEGSDRPGEDKGNDGNGGELTEFLEDEDSGNLNKATEFLEDKQTELISKQSDISSRKTSDLQFLEDENELLKISSRNKRRHKGEGSGCIYYRTVTKKGKDYYEAYYQYEFWGNGKRLVKSSKYIPKRLLKQVELMEAEKVPVTEILDALGVIYW